MKSILKDEKSLIFKILLLIKGYTISFFIILLRVFPIKKNRVFVISYYGKEYGDSGKYIVNELLKKKDKYEIYWTLSNLNNNVPLGVNKLKYKSFKYYYILATSKVWINNCRFPFWIKKRKNQFYIQVWHGSIALKKLEFDVKLKLGYRYIKSAENDNKMIDCLISNSDFCTNMYRGAFRLDKKIYELGTPRNDILVHSNENVVKKVKNYFDLKKEKIVLYAPTFRKEYSNQYNIDFVNLIKTLNNKYKNEWKVILRLHPNVRDKASEYAITFNDNVLDASFYDDMQELIVASDLIITDYSSLMFDGIIAKKPVLLYATDVENYNDERGTYFSFDELPFKKSNNNEELLKIIRNDNFDDMTKEYKSFSKKIGLKETGNASYEVAKIIENNIYGG